MVYTDFDSSASCFRIFMVSKPRRCALDLGLGFIDAIVEATGKVAERKMNLAKL